MPDATGPITLDRFRLVEAQLRVAGFYDDDVQWSENAGPPEDPEDFASEAIFVICNSGMKNTVARRIYDRVMPMVRMGGSARNVFRHPGKSDAIDVIWVRRDQFYSEYMAAPDKVEYCATLPWIGGITKFHLAKNFGVNVAKPDVHLARLAELHATTPQALCERLAGETGFRAATIDLLLWRACAIGVLDGRTGLITAAAPPGPDQSELFP